MLDAARAMIRTGGASAASGLCSMAAAKIVASVAGPAGLGLLSTLQQTRQTALIAATLNGQTALVQGVSARDGEARSAFIRTVMLLIAIATVLVCGLLMAA